MRSATPAGRPSTAEFRPHAERIRASDGPRDLARAAVSGQPPPRPCPAAGNTQRDQRRDTSLLELLVDREVVPRLARIHQLDDHPSMPDAPSALDVSDEVATLVAVLSPPHARTGEELVDILVRQGWTYDRLLLGLLQPAARRLGTLWEEDACCFSDVTIALLRLRDLLRTLSTRFQRSARPLRGDLRACLAAVPGEQHVFGVEMLATLFRRAGWDVVGAVHDTEAALVARVGQNSYEIIGLSLSGETHLDTLAAFIKRLRRASRNRAAGIMVGGNLFNQRPELVTAVGADLSATDGPGAVAAAERWAGAVVDT